MGVRSGDDGRSHDGVRWIRVGAVPLGALALMTAVGRPVPVSAASTPASATPCAAGTPGAAPDTAGTPLPAASPALEASPVTTTGLRITLAAASDQAGPDTLIVGVTDPHCGPVSGATVTIATQSLDMNMGTETNRAIERAPGRYVAQDVPMGMGGRWKAEVKVERAGQPPVAAEFVVKLKGPM